MNTPATEPSAESDAAIAQAFREVSGGPLTLMPSEQYNRVMKRAREIDAKALDGVASERSSLLAMADNWYAGDGYETGIKEIDDVTNNRWAAKRECADELRAAISAPAAAPVGGFVVDEDALFKLFYDTHVAEFARLEPITRPDYAGRMQDNTDAATKAALRAVYAELTPTAQPSAKDGVRVSELNMEYSRGRADGWEAAKNKYATTASGLVDGVVVADVVVRDCGYGFSGWALMSDGTMTAHTTRLHATSEQAQAEVSAILTKNRGPQA